MTHGRRPQGHDDRNTGVPLAHYGTFRMGNYATVHSGNQAEPVQRAVAGLRSAEEVLLEQARIVDLEAPDQVVEAVTTLLATAKQIVVDTSIWLELAERGDSAVGAYHRRFAEDREVLSQHVDLLRDKIRQDLQGQ
ncbi:hypothetical protein N4G70_27560 [Streptomyces sp. ASQP_92]|uniref:hypothetical protein n=1 Tax=Streptomyces sp. ASQP_92 TaxID=2979116 RepID=UPI0021C235C8|nr:hypothetical protein [Streptomyces sp. ASQP_92]MCT9092597.1 hypothetical protein [Streptomyces sp. ASQP_92]